jgi:hypothetical protein
MKNCLLITMMIVGYQAAAQLTTDDFNQMIQENQRAEVDLRKKLQKEAGIELRKDQYGKVDSRKLDRPRVAEQVAVAGENPSLPQRKDSSAKDLHKAAMKRVAEEIKEADSN